MDFELEPQNKTRGSWVIWLIAALGIILAIGFYAAGLGEIGPAQGATASLNELSTQGNPVSP